MFTPFKALAVMFIIAILSWIFYFNDDTKNLVACCILQTAVFLLSRQELKKYYENKKKGAQK